MTKTPNEGLKTEIWSPERLTAHLKEIGAYKPPEPRNQFEHQITAPKQGRRGKYLK